MRFFTSKNWGAQMEKVPSKKGRGIEYECAKVRIYNGMRNKLELKN